MRRCTVMWRSGMKTTPSVRLAVGHGAVHSS
jgi:hypothetical protein